MVGFRKALGINSYEFPRPLDVKMTLRDALHYVPKPKASDICQGEFSSRYMSRNRKRKWSEVSYTIPAMSKQVTLQPGSLDMKKISDDVWVFGSEKSTRRFSWQEAAAIQTFPLDMKFVENLTSKYKQIGNAVPVRLAEVIGTDIKSILHTCFSNTIKNEME